MTNARLKDYYDLQTKNGSAWTTRNIHYQEMLKQAMDWLISCLEDKKYRILDLGCGDGWGTEYLTAKLPRSEVTGGDIDRNKLAYARHRGVRVRFMDMHRVLGKWDIIFCSHSLEHSYDLKKALNSILNHLVPGGKLYLIVPIEPEIPTLADGSHTQVIKSEKVIIDYLAERDDVVTEFSNMEAGDVLEYWTIVRKTK